MPLSNNSLQVDAENWPIEARRDYLRAWLPFICAATAYLTLIAKMASLLRDSDTYWHIVVGQWIIDHRAVPHVDMFSFTMRGEPWITSAWLSEVLYFVAYKLVGWSGPAILAALSASIGFFLLTHLLLKRLPNVTVMILVSAGIVMTSNHTLARPHVLIFPLMVLWADGLLCAIEQRRTPSMAYLALIALWANLHGSFTLGLALIAPFALDALLTTDKSARVTVAFRWSLFGIMALGASCVTPYGVDSILVTIRILKLGPVLSSIGEWRALDFGELHPFTICILAGAAYVLFSGLKLPPLRTAAVLGLVYETLTHERYVDVSALVAPFFIAGPLGQHLSWPQLQRDRKTIPVAGRAFVTAVAALVIATGVIAATRDHTPPLIPRGAVEKLTKQNASRVLNDYYFGGYLIFQGIPTFIDSRAELYGAAFLARYMRAIALEDLADFVKLLDEYKIDSTLLFPSTAAVGLLDRLPEWERVYADQVAVVHVRRKHPGNANPLK